MGVQSAQLHEQNRKMSRTSVVERILLVLLLPVVFVQPSANAVKHKSLIEGRIKSNYCPQNLDQVKWKSSLASDGYMNCSFENWPVFKCSNGNCFTMQQTCDGHDDCGDSTDECESMCRQTFRCNDSKACIAMDMFCDGNQDCADGSDEMTGGDSEQGFVCANGWGITMDVPNTNLHWKERRVSKNYCASDIFNLIQSGMETKRRCGLPKKMLCDGVNHCGDHSDECSPEAGCGPDNKFICDNKKCIAKMHVCDGIDDCGDSSDECNNCTKNFICNDGTCIAFQHFCNGVVDCPDGSDELTSIQLNSKISKTANDSRVICSNFYNLATLKCVLPQRYICDGHEQCVNREDECVPSCSFSFICSNARCIVEARKCDGWDDCGDMSDECNPKCRKKFECDDGSCLALNRFCDGTPDCPNGEDEIETGDGFFCSSIQSSHTASLKKKCLLPHRHVCDEINHCLDRKDECEPGCKSSFFCDQSGNNSSQCVSRSGLCNGISECKDLTDEPLLKGPISTQRGFKCMVPRRPERTECVLPEEFVGDLIDDCVDDSDSCVINNTGNNYSNASTCTTCLKRTEITVSKMQLCDGMVDCPDLSDECLCQENKILHICQHICFDKPDEVKCPCSVGMVPCLITENTENYIYTKYPFLHALLKEANDTQCINASQFCDGNTICKNYADEIYCDASESSNVSLDRSMLKRNRTNQENHVSRFSCFEFQKHNMWTPQYAIRCDGNPECFNMEDECDVGCDPLPKFCSMRSPGGTFNCPNNQILPGRLICNGIADCSSSDKSDELDCPGRTKCKSGKILSVENYKLCNFVNDCEDRSDEIDCNDTHFYCENQKDPFFVRRRDVMDGVDDCSDGSDECPNEFFGNSVFSSIDFMIKSAFLQGMVWIMGLLAVVGNLLVFVHTISLLNQSGRQRLSKVAVVYNTLVLNLSFADFLMGIFLIALGVNNALMSGKYCLSDRSWRTGTTCAILGVLATLSAEVSLTTLALLSSYRMYCVMKPIQSRGLKLYKAIFLIVCVWALAVLVAVLPFHEGFKNYFISDVWMQNNPYFLRVLISKGELTDFCDRVLGYDNSWANIHSNMTSIEYCSNWDNAIDSVARLNTTHEIKGLLGYYGTHSTCLPKMFLTREDTAWEYSLGVTIYNFVVCLYIVFAYSIIWKPRQVNQTSIASKGARSMQRRIAILIVTDCLCWMPICIIAFLCFAGFGVSDGVYAFTAIVLLPINSALNPVFYSNALQRLQTKLHHLFLKVCGPSKIRKTIRNKTVNLQKTLRNTSNEDAVTSLLPLPPIRSSKIVTETQIFYSTALTESRV